MRGDKRSIGAIPLLAAFAIVSLSSMVHLAGATAASELKRDVRTCQSVGAWLDPETGETVAVDRLFRSLAKRKIVLLGETHANFQDQLWQLHSLAGLHAHRSKLAAGFEMFPRKVQSALDAWSQGRHTEKEFLKASRWREVWGYDPELYLPLFRFVQQNRLPMIALNVDRKLISRVGRDGWSSVPEEAREGVSDPAPASDAYRHALAEVYMAKRKQGLKEPSPHGPRDKAKGQHAKEAPDLSAILRSEDFARFVEAQLTWDRAMAEALFKASRESPDALVVGVLGRGHIEHGYGVPHQLADLGEESVAILLPMDTGRACAVLDPQIADAIFVVAPAEERRSRPAKPRLGVMIEQAEDGIRILDVVEGSVAEATGLLPGDVIVSAAAVRVSKVAQFIEIVQRQAPGTWLPLEFMRDGKKRQFVAKFPVHFK